MTTISIPTLVASWGPTILLLLAILGFGIARIFEFRGIRKDHAAAARARDEAVRLAQERRDEEFLQVAIHQEFHKKSDGLLSFSDVRSGVANSAFWRSSVTIDKDKLTDDRLRLLIVAMIEKGVIEQMKEDKYILKLRQAPPEIEGWIERAGPVIMDMLKEVENGFPTDVIRSKLGYLNIQLNEYQVKVVLARLEAMKVIEWNQMVSKWRMPAPIPVGGPSNAA